MAQKLQVVACDDDKAFCTALAQKLDTLFTQHAVAAELHIYHSLEALLQYEGEIHLAFLDIEMPDAKSGFEAARQITAINRDALCIFVTSHDQYAKQAFSVHPFQYVSKAQLAQELPAAVSDALATLRSHQGIYLEDAHCFLRARSVLYIEASRNYSILHQEGGAKYVTRKTMQEWAALLGPAFFQCHKSYIVNLAHAHQLEGSELRLSNGGSVPCARRQRAGFSQAVAAYVTTYGRYI